MPRECSVCCHSQCRQIDAALVEGASAREVASRFDLGWQAVNRHRLNHLPIAIRRAAREAVEAQEAATHAIPPQAAESPVPTTGAHSSASQPAPDPIAAHPAGRRRAIDLGDGDGVSPGETVAQDAPSTSSRSDPPASSANPPAGVFNAYEQAIDLRSRALAILAQAEADRDLKTALTAIREARGVLEHLSRLEERQSGNAQAVPLAQSAEWARTRTAIVNALADYPDARIAVAEALVATGAL